jgi:succinate-semialdehyde dehydrogenase/glutarate-semialdehyde dehydrogenase
MVNLGDMLRRRREEIGRLISIEMGCPLGQTLAEVEKCAFVADYYANSAEQMLSPELVDGNPSKQIHFDPLGPVLHVAPWNYPMYLALRPAIPAIMAGNTILLKHASNTPQCSLLLQELFELAGFEVGVFQSLLIGAGKVELVINHPSVSMITLIGSSYAGSQVAKVAGSQIKKTVMELGGSDPFIVLADADLDKAVKAAVASRLRNAGQSCNAAKRFIIHDSLVSDFVDRLRTEFEAQIVGDPLQDGVDIGPLATAGSLQEIQNQTQQSILMGAKLVCGGQIDGPGYFYKPTILTNVTSNMPVWTEEVFGPVAPIVTFNNPEEAIGLANQSQYGLGSSIWTQNLDLAKQMIPRLEAGSVFINKPFRSDPKIPFGGIKKSGYGREFGREGIREFVNIKGVVIA